MYLYKCYACGGLCDAGELENGVCYDCRQEDLRRMEARSLQKRKELNQLIRSKYAEQTDGQMVMVMGDVMEQELVGLGLHREDLYKRQRKAYEAYEMEEGNDGELRSTGTTASRKDHL